MSKKKPAAGAVTAESMSRHRSVWDMRADGWIGMVDDLSRLSEMARDHADWDRLQ